MPRAMHVSSWHIEFVFFISPSFHIIPQFDEEFYKYLCKTYGAGLRERVFFFVDNRNVIGKDIPFQLVYQRRFGQPLFTKSVVEPLLVPWYRTQRLAPAWARPASRARASSPRAWL